jgi:predicted Zn-dependent protease
MRQTAARVMARDEMRALLERVLARSKAERSAAALYNGWTGNTRFAANQMSTAGSVEDTSLSIESWFGNRHASVETNDLSEAALERAVRTSE